MRISDWSSDVCSSDLQNSNNSVNQALEQAKQALALTQEQSGQISALESSLRQFQGQVDGLDQAFQTLTDSGSDLVLINDVDHLVTIAQQQLQLGGNVANAVISLETAQAQLARANRPGLASLQQTLNGRSEEHTSELQSLMRISYAVFCLKKKKN